MAKGMKNAGTIRVRTKKTQKLIGVSIMRAQVQPLANRLTNPQADPLLALLRPAESVIVLMICPRNISMLHSHCE